MGCCISNFWKKSSASIGVYSRQNSADDESGPFAVFKGSALNAKSLSEADLPGVYGESQDRLLTLYSDSGSMDSRSDYSSAVTFSRTGSSRIIAVKSLTYTETRIIQDSLYPWRHHKPRRFNSLPELNTIAFEKFKQMQGKLFSIGHPLMDISAKVPPSFLEKFHLKSDAAMELTNDHREALYTEVMLTFPVWYSLGGSEQNCLRVIQSICLVPRLTTFLGCIGSDMYGEMLKACMLTAGVRVIYHKSSRNTTGVCCVLIPNSTQRTLVSYSGATQESLLPYLKTKKSQELMHQAQCFYIECYSVKFNYSAMLHIAKYAVKNNRVVALNLSASYAIEKYPEKVDHVIQYVDFVFCNESEAQSFLKAKHKLSKIQISDISTLIRYAAKYIADRPKKNKRRPRTVVITRGADPVVVAHQHGVNEYPVLPLRNSFMRDSVAAGDSFVGGFLSGLLLGYSLPQCVCCALRASRFMVQQQGCRLPEEGLGNCLTPGTKVPLHSISLAQRSGINDKALQSILLHLQTHQPFGLSDYFKRANRKKRDFD